MVLARWCLAALIAFPVLVFCQSESPSLGDVARQSRATHTTEPTKTKHVLEDEDVASHKGPIPEISLTQTSNAQQIIAAIQTYGEKHNDQETEQAVHEWYDDEMNIVRAALHHRVTIYQDRMTPGTSNTLDQQHYYDDYREYQESQSSKFERDISDLKQLGGYDQVISRISGGLRAVKIGIETQKRFQYSWFDTDYPVNRTVLMPKRPNEGYNP